MTSRRWLGFAFLVLSAVLMAATPCRPAWAHGPSQIVQETFVFIDGIRIVVEYRTTFGAVLARVKLIAADTDGDGRLSATEKRALLEGFGADVLAKLKVSLDGRPLGMRYAEGRLISPPLRGLGDTASILVRFEGELGEIRAGPHLLRLADGNFSETVLGRMAFYVRAGPRTEGLEVSSDGRTLAWTFLHSTEGGGPSDHQGTAEFHAAGGGGVESPGGAGTLAGLVQREEVTLAFVLVALVVAAGLGAAHALSPGHGKAMVAAYLIGSKGRIIDAILLGGVVTFTHMISVIVLGVVALVLTEYLAPQDLYPWLGFASGCLIFAIGYWLLASRALGLGHAHSGAHAHSGTDSADAAVRPGGHGHDHDHAHEHGHEHPHVRRGDVTLGSLVSLGVSGGMVPCPSALVVLLAAVAMHRIVFGLILILAFSVGLAAVLILIGVLAVTATRFMTRSTRRSRWVRALPVFSAGVIMLVGIMLAFSSLLTGNVLVAGR